MRVGTTNIADPNGHDANKIYTPSGERSASALIKTGGAVVGAAVVTTDGTNDALLLIYNGTNDTGTIVARIPVAGADSIGGVSIPFIVTTGIYAKLTGTGAKYHVYYL